MTKKEKSYNFIDHIGVAIPNLDEAMALYTKLLGKAPEHIEEVAEQKVKAAFFQVGESNIELLEATSEQAQ